MDIFEIAQQGMQIQEQEKKELEAEAASEAKAKAFKLDIKEAIYAVSRKDYDWFNRLGENQKSFSPFMLNMWLGKVWTPNTSRALSGNDVLYADTLKDINYTLNRQVFQVPKEMFWLLACSIQEYINYKTKEVKDEDGNIFLEYVLDKDGNKIIDSYLEWEIDWVKSAKKESEGKIPKKVIDYMAQELFSSSEKIYDMIDNGLITDEDMKAIALDLDTLEEQKKKKK